MADKSQPSTSRSVKGNALTTGRKPATAPAAGSKPQLKTAGRTLLPSKMKSTSTAPPGPMKARSGLMSSRRNPANRQMDDLYDMYLIDLINRALIQDVENLAETGHLDRQAKSVVGVIAGASDLVKLHVDKVILKIWEQLKQLESISGAFDNLVDFAGEETLVEIQTLLMKKYEKIYVDGATVDGSVFHDVDLKAILEMLRQHLRTKDDKNKISGFVQAFSDTLKSLHKELDHTEKTSKDLQVQNKIALEHCSLSACNKARESYFEEDEKDEDTQEEVHGGKEAVKPDED